MSRTVNELYKKDGCKKQRQNPTTSLASWRCRGILRSFSPELNLWPTGRPCLHGPRLGLQFQQRNFAPLMLQRLNVNRKLLNTYINVFFPQIWAFYSSFQKAQLHFPFQRWENVFFLLALHLILQRKIKANPHNIQGCVSAIWLPHSVCRLIWSGLFWPTEFWEAWRFLRWLYKRSLV